MKELGDSLDPPKSYHLGCPFSFHVGSNARKWLMAFIRVVSDLLAFQFVKGRVSIRFLVNHKA